MMAYRLKWVCEAIRTRPLYVFTHADRRTDFERRLEWMMAGLALTPSI
jgi:hypothetical protein